MAKKPARKKKRSRARKTERLKSAARGLHEGEQHRHVFLEQLARTGLTRREQEVALLVVEGFSNREIAEHLLIREQTVKDHLHKVFEKMGIRRRSELAAKLAGLA